MSPKVVSVIESTPHNFSLIFGAGLSAEEELRIRRQIRRVSQFLRKKLRLRESPISVEDSEPLMIRFSGVTGTLRLGHLEVEVAPKHAPYATGGGLDWRPSVIAMIERTSHSNVNFSRSKHLQLKHQTFIDQFAFGYGAELEEALSGTPIRQYRPIRLDSKYLRGRLLIAEQLRQSLSRPDLVACEIEELHTDNPQNHLLHWVGADLMRKARNPQVRRFLSEQLARLPVMTSKLHAPTQRQIALPRQYSHYRSVISLASAYLRGRTTYPGAKDVGGGGFLVGTERLFESFVEKSLRVVARDHSEERWSVRAQAREVFAVSDGTGRDYFSKPDNVLDVDGIPTLVIDAKYKRFRDGNVDSAGSKPSNTDVYQMMAACMAHSCRTALLLYPRLATADDDPPLWDIAWWEVVGPASESIRIGAATVDIAVLQEPKSISEFDHKLSALVKSALAKSPTTTSHKVEKR